MNPKTLKPTGLRTTSSLSHSSETITFVQANSGKPEPGFRKNSKQYQSTARRDPCKISFADICRENLHFIHVPSSAEFFPCILTEFTEDQSQEKRCVCVHACICQGLKGPEEQLRLDSQEVRIAALTSPG